MMLTNDELSMPLELKPTKCVSPTSTLNVRGSVQYCMKFAFCTAKTKDSSGPHTGSRLPGPDGAALFWSARRQGGKVPATLPQTSGGSVPREAFQNVRYHDCPVPLFVAPKIWAWSML